MTRTVDFCRWITITFGPNHKPVVRMTANKPTVGRFSIAMKLNFEIPAALFQTPHIEATIALPDDGTLVMGRAAKVELADHVRHLIESGSDLNVDVRILPVAGEDD